MNVINSVTLYLFVISLLYCLRYAIEFIMKFFTEDPEQFELDFTRKFYFLVSSSYIITYFINLF